MQIRWFKRRWDETRGDGFDSWGAATYFFEVTKEGWPSRQIEVYDSGPTLRYGPDHLEDEYGRLGQAQLDEREDWSDWAISSDEFENMWSGDA
ncbi:hypothetical protein [Angustibacter luteus]|uniref:Uncharacterized protein n=1 Tax=Angustibacter luteus TaxID=658456 RepID=A0ABW1JAL3_9ACTN